MILSSYSPGFSLVIFIFSGCISIYKLIKYMRYEPIDATVIEKVGYTKTGARHVVEYHYAGQLYTSTTEDRTWFTKKDGEYVKCFVNPNNPEQIILAGEKGRTWLLLALAVLCGSYSALRLFM